MSAPAAPVTTVDPRRAHGGLAYGLAAYLAWGLAPAYYRLLDGVTPVQILAHRIFWSLIFLLPLVAYRRMWGDVARVLRDRRTLLTLVASTAFITANWYTFIYAVDTRRIVESALGYYMNPLVVVLLGVVFLKERLRPWQLASLVLAAIAVAILTVAQGKPPVLSVVLAVSFAVYGLLRKTVDAGPLVGLFVETLILLPVVAVLIAVDLSRPETSRPVGTYALLAGAGVVTAVPLLWFANAARRLRLATMGLLQYLAPTVSFLWAVTFFNEPFAGVQRVAFPMIWLALVIFSIDSLRAYRAARPEVPVASPS